MGTEHLLLGLIREQEGVAARVLTNLGLNLDRVRNEILQLLADPKSSRMETPPYRTGDLINGSRPRTSLRIWLFLAIAAGLALILVSFLRPRRAGIGRAHPAVGQKLPPIELTPLTSDGDPVTSADLAERVVVLNFWGTWCPPCRAELPHVAALGQRYADNDGFMLLAVSCGSGPESEDHVDNLRAPTAALLDQQGLSLAAYADPEGQARDQLARLGLFEHGYPTTLVIDGKGVVRGVWMGYAPGDERHVAAIVAELLSTAN